MTFIEANVLKLNDRVISEESHTHLHHYLQLHHKDGFKQECEIYINETKIDLVNYDMPLNDGDVIVLLYRPAIAAAMGITNVVAAFFVNMLAAAAISFVVSKIFAPTMPQNQSVSSNRNSRGKASSTYSLNSQQNEAKRGEVIPVIYGKVRTYPALIAPPYYRFENNEEYLYQLMCIGQGTYNIDSMLIGDTDVIDIQSDYFRYEQLLYNDFKTVQGITDKINDSNYYGLVKQIPDVDNLELRGTPQNKSMSMRFENNTITFYDYGDGSSPDLGSLLNGSTITITETLNNDGVYTVDSVIGNVVTIQSHTFVTEPTGFAKDASSANYYHILTYSGYSENSFVEGHNSDTQLYDDNQIDTVFSRGSDIFTIRDRIATDSARLTFTNPEASPYVEYNETDLILIAKPYNAEFFTSYGAYSYNKNHIGFEVDIVYPNGVYNSDSSTGDFLARSTEMNIGLDNSNITETKLITTDGKVDNGAIRVTYKYIYGDNGHTTTQDSMHLTFKRITPEPTDIQSNDKTFIKSVKFIEANVDYESLGNVTLLWCKIRASNAISSIGQFSINAWVTRSDVNSDINSVCTDLYTNDVYGGRLPLSDLDFPTTTETVNGALDTTMTLYDALDMVSKSRRYSVYPVGGDLKLKLDTKKPIRTALYNETNILQDTLKISYLFTEEDEQDSVEIKYRSATDFSEQSVQYPSAGLFPKTIELWGCTDADVALDTATYLFLQDRSRRKTVEFKTDIQGLIPQYLDKIAISHNIPQWGLGGQIVAIDGNKLTLDCDYDLFVATIPCDDTISCDESFCTQSGNIIFRDVNGSVSSIYELDVISEKEVVLKTAPPTWLYVGYDYDNTFFSIGKTSTFIRDYIIIKVEPDSSDNMKITATNYDPSIFDYPEGDILTESGDSLLTESGDNLRHEG